MSNCTNNFIKRVIGVTRTFQWTITTNGAAVPLVADDLTLHLVPPRGEAVSLPFDVDGNIVSFTWQGDDQHIIGCYSLILWANFGEDNQRRVDIHNFLELIPWSDRQSGEYSDLVEETIELETADFGENIMVVDNLNSTSATDALSANMGRQLNVTKQDVIQDLATIRSGAAAGAAVKEWAKNDPLITDDATQASASKLSFNGNVFEQWVPGIASSIGLKGIAGFLKLADISQWDSAYNDRMLPTVAAVKAKLQAVLTALGTIEAVIPSQASSTNKLTDKDYVDGAIATNTANFVGTFDTLAELQAVQNPTKNDYGFVIEQDAQGNEYYDRYKYTGTQWLYEYKVESTPFTTEQWAAIQSGITAALVSKLSALPTNAELNTALASKQPVINDLTTIRSGAAAGATAYQKPSGGIPASDMAAAVQTSLGKADSAYQKPSSGIPASDMAIAVQASLGKADAAAPQSTTYTKTEVDAALALKQTSSQLATINGSDITHGGNVTIVAAEGQTITIDAAPTEGSSNAVSSGGTYNAISPLEQIIDGVTIRNYTDGYKVLQSGALQAEPTSVVCEKVPVAFGQTITFKKSYSYICAYDANDVKIGDWSARTNVILTNAAYQNVAYILASFLKENLATASVTRGSEVLWKPSESYIPGITDRVEDLEETQSELQLQAVTKNYIPNSWTSTTGIFGGHSGYIVTEKIAGVSGEIVYLENCARYALAFDASGNQLGYRDRDYLKYVLPEGTASFVVCFAPDATDLRVYKDGVVVWEKTDGPSRLVDYKSLIDNTDKEVEIVSAISQDAFNSSFYEEIIPPTFSFPYNITNDGKIGTSSSYKHIILCVEEGDTIRLNEKSHVKAFYYAFLTTPEVTNTPGEALPLVNGTLPVMYSTKGHLGQPLMGDVVVSIPAGCKALIVDVQDISAAYFVAYIRRNKTSGVVSCYKEYIKNRAFEIRKRDITLGQNADSFIFLTDYHIDPSTTDSITTNFGHSPALVKYLQEHTNTERFLFGGDVFGSPNDDAERFSLMDEFLTLFNFTTMYAAVGNHEWRQSSALNNDGRTYDFGSLAKKLEGLVTFGRNAQGQITQPYYYYDNPTLKIRYFVLYTPGPNRNSSYAIFDYDEQLNFVSSKLGELDSSWSAVIMQHIVYGSGSGVTPEYDGDGFPIKYPTTDVGNAIKSFISQTNLGNGAKVITLLSGHMHNDFCEFVDGHCISICVDCDATYGRYNGNNDVVYPNNPIRRWGTTNEQCFDVFHILTDGSKIFGTRIGFGYDKVINITEQAVGVGSSITLTPTIGTPDEWITQDSSVATVSNGVVTGVAQGRVTIKAKVSGTDNGKWEYFNILVS